MHKIDQKVTKDFYFFLTFYLSKNPEKCFTEVLTSTSVCNTDNNNKCFLSILEWFLKDNVTLKTGEIAAENSALHHKN